MLEKTYRSAKRSSSRSSGSVMLITMYWKHKNTNDHSLAQETGFVDWYCGTGQSTLVRVRKGNPKGNSARFNLRQLQIWSGE